MARFSHGSLTRRCLRIHFEIWLLSFKVRRLFGGSSLGQNSLRYRTGPVFSQTENDSGSGDEPYLFVVYARLDGGILDSTVAPQNRTAPIRFPERLGHGNLGPDSKGMSKTGRNIVKVPADPGRWETTIDTTNLDISVSAMRNCSVAIGLVFMEEDSTLDSTIEAVVQELKPAVRRTANNVLRLFLGVMPEIPAGIPGRDAILAALEAYRKQMVEGGLDPNGILNGSSFIDRVMDKLLPCEIGKAVGKTFIPGGEIINWIAGIVQAADRDEFVGANGKSFGVYEIIGKNHAPIDFDMESLQYTTLPVPLVGSQTVRVTSKGVYAVDGTVRRTDTDEVPVLGLMRGPGNRAIAVARRLDGDHFSRRQTDDFGKEWKVVHSSEFGSRDFRSGPAAASALDGMVQCVAGRSTDDEIWWNYSTDAGASWGGWNRVTQRRTFVSSPAVALSEDGATIYLTARESDNTYWFTRSENRGESWAPWRRIGTGVFHSSPAMVRVQGAQRGRGEGPDTLVVAGLGTNKRVYTTRFHPDRSLDGQDWKPIGAGADDHPTSAFTSAPAMTCDGQDRILLVCRAKDLLYWRCESFNGGDEFKTGTSWMPVGRAGDGPVKYPDGERRGDLQDLYSAPAIVASNDMETWLLAGLSPTLSLWRNRCARHKRARWRPTGDEPEKDLRPHFY